MADIAVLIFLLQQLGIALGLGAATFSLLFYVLSLQDGVVDASEKHFMHATTTVLVVALFLNCGYWCSYNRRTFSCR